MRRVNLILFVVSFAQLASAAAAGLSPVKISDRNNCSDLSEQRLAVKAGVLQLSDAQFRRIFSPIGNDDVVRRYVDCARYIAVNVASATWAEAAISGIQVVGDPVGTAISTAAELMDSPNSQQVGGAKTGATLGAMAGAIVGAMTDSRGPLSGVIKGGTAGAVVGGVGGAMVAPMINAGRAHATALKIAEAAKVEGRAMIDEGILRVMRREQDFDRLMADRERDASTEELQKHVQAIQIYAEGLADRVETNTRY